MTIALLIAGYEQSFIERAVEGSTWAVILRAKSPVISKCDGLAFVFWWHDLCRIYFVSLDLLTIGKAKQEKRRDY